MATYDGIYSSTAGTDVIDGSIAGDGAPGLLIDNGTDNTLTAASVVTGGAGGDSAADAMGFAQGFGGNGGVGVDLSASSSLTNLGVIVGGDGGSGQFAGNGGTGILVDGGSTVVNEGTITGGDAGGSGGINSLYGGVGGVGVDMTVGGTLQNAGTIGGGSGADAVHFGAGDSRLIIDAGAVFDGAVVADAGFNNVIELNAGGAPGTISGIGTQYQNFQTVQMDAGADWTINGAIGSFVSVDLGGADAALSDTLSISDASGFAAEISNFDINDTINLDNVAFGSITGSSFDESTGLLTLNTAGGDITLDFATPSNFDDLFFNFVSDGGIGTNITLSGTPCYCPGTLILTERGEVPVEALVIGDRVVTFSGALEPIKWIGRRSYAGRFIADSKFVQPVRIRAGALADGLPRRDLLISPQHAMYFYGALVTAGALVNGTSIVQEQVQQVEYIHIELNTHDVIWAEGAASETYIDCDNRGIFHNADDYAQRYPDAGHTAAQHYAPRLSEGYALEAIRRRIAQRAALCAAA